MTVLPRGMKWLSVVHPAGLAIADQALVSAAGFLHLIAAARCLSIEDFGVFSLAWTVLLFAGSVHYALVLQPMAVLYGEFHTDTAKSYLHRTEKWHFLLLLLLAPAGMAAWILPDWSALILATAVTSLFRMWSEHERRTAYVLNDSSRAVMIDFTTYGPLAAISALFWWQPVSLPVELVMIVAAVPACAGSLLGRYLMQAARAPASESGPLNPARTHWSFGKWGLASAVAMQAGTQLYPFLVVGFLGLREVAALNAGRSLIGLAHVVMNGVDAYSSPRLRGAFLTGGGKMLKKTLWHVFLFMLIALSPVFLVSFVFPGRVLEFVMGSAYAEYGWILRMMGVIYVFLFLSKLLLMALHALKEPRPATIGYLAGAIATLALGPVIVPHWGLPGVLWAMAVNSVMLFGVLALGTWRTLSAVKVR